MRDLRIVRGNDFPLVAPVRSIVYVRDEYGNVEKSAKDVPLDRCTVLRVSISDVCDDFRAVPFVVHGSDLVVNIPGSLECGWYGIEVVYTLDGRNYRSYERKVFKIVENNGKSFVGGDRYIEQSDGGEPSYQVETMWTLNAQGGYPMMLAIDPETMTLNQYGVFEDGEMYIDEDGELCMRIYGE